MDYQLSFDDNPALVKLANAWDRAMERLRPTMSDQQYQKFLKPLRPSGREGHTVVVAAPGTFITQWVKKNFCHSIEEALSDELGEQVLVDLVAESRPKAAAVAQTEAQEEPASEKFSDRFTFENFIVGQSNRLAHAGAFAVANEPGKKYNPLFIYGGSGLGKTHLLHAISNVLRQGETPVEVSYITSQEFAERFVNALQHGRIEQFRRSIRSAAVWLLDDVQFIAGKDKTQEELFHSFNQLQQAGKQIVFTSDRPPRELYAMDDRLRSRFECGLVADIMPPDTETRTAIAKAKSEAEGIELDHEVCEYLAINVPGNIRTLEGALTKLIAHASFESRPITVELAKQIIDEAYPPTANHKPSFDKILEAVCTYYDVPRRDILGPSRKADIAHARHICVYLCRNISGDSWKRLGERFGHRDHTSMIHAHRKVSVLAVRDLETQTDLRNIERGLHPDL